MHESNRTEWCYTSGEVCVLESFLLKRDFFERLINLEKHEEVFLSLSDSPLKDHFGHIEHLYEFERILEERYLNEIYVIRKSSPDPALSNIFLIKYDFTNLKNFLKELLAGIPREAPTFINIEDSEWERLWKGKSTELGPIYEDAIKIIKENSSEKNQIPFIIDLALDNAYLCYLGHMVSKLDSPLIKEYFETYFTIKGTEIILRVLVNKCEKKQISKIFLKGIMQKDFLLKLIKCHYEGCPGVLRGFFPSELVEEIFAGPRKNLFTRFGRLTENYLLGKLYPAKFAPFGAERVFGYLCGLTTETYNLRLTLGGKINRVNVGLIKERLREPYV
ncbi:MAG: V-type ATPase subunit [Candidatus Brocadiales bacterium]